MNPHVLAFQLYERKHQFGRRLIPESKDPVLRALTEERRQREFPFDYVREVHIEDTRGLEYVLDRTTKREELEWGMLVQATREDETARITSLIGLEALEQQGRVVRNRDSIEIRIPKSERGAYQGTHHYHPPMRSPFVRWIPTGWNFAVDALDRHTWELDAINLLSFNMSYGPELIGYNTRSTFIPADASKRHLVQASPREIAAYIHKRT